MNPPNIQYAAILIFASVACLVVASVVWMLRGKGGGAIPFAAMLMGLSWWDITYAIFWIDFPAPNPYFWLDITLVGAFIVPTAFLIFVLGYSGLNRWLQRPFILILMVEPILAFILQWTDPWHNLFFGGKRALNTTMILDAGPVSWANIYYSYLLIFISVLILLVSFFRSKGLYRNQTGLILGAVILPWVAHIVFVINGNGLLPNADMTPFLFSISSVLIAFSLFRYRFLDIIPIARSILIENMGEGVLVVDAEQRVLDVNPVARQVLLPGFSIGDKLDQAFEHHPSLVSIFKDETQSQTAVTLNDRHLDLRITRLDDAKGQKVGRLIIWRDVTDLKNYQLKLERLATTDELTLLYNRRHFLELAEAQVNQAHRRGGSLSLAMIDLDHFKSINDEFGHLSGDNVLSEFARIMRENIREFDVFSRLGGEEFALLMVDADETSAVQIVERLRKIIAESNVVDDVKQFPVTFSAGVSGLIDRGDTMEDLLRRADHALYIAKRTGRNRVVVSTGPENETV
ncbi:MAG: diguanylate cyclase [Anaerolineae bacterium]